MKRKQLQKSQTQKLEVKKYIRKTEELSRKKHLTTWLLTLVSAVLSAIAGLLGNLSFDALRSSSYKIFVLVLGGAVMAFMIVIEMAILFMAHKPKKVVLLKQNVVVAFLTALDQSPLNPNTGKRYHA